jgi:hypothetical protein
VNNHPVAIKFVSTQTIATIQLTHVLSRNLVNLMRRNYATNIARTVHLMAPVRALAVTLVLAIADSMYSLPCLGRTLSHSHVVRIQLVSLMFITLARRGYTTYL